MCGCKCNINIPPPSPCFFPIEASLSRSWTINRIYKVCHDLNFRAFHTTLLTKATRCPWGHEKLFNGVLGECITFLRSSSMFCGATISHHIPPSYLRILSLNACISRCSTWVWAWGPLYSLPTGTLSLAESSKIPTCHHNLISINPTWTPFRLRWAVTIIDTQFAFWRIS